MSNYTKTVDEKNNSLIIERRFHAPKHVMWDYHAKRDMLESWWGPEGYPTTITKFDFKVGGEWHYYMTGPDGGKYGGIGAYKAIDPGNVLEYDDYFADDAGNRNADLPATHVRLEFHAAGNDTVLKVILKFANAEDLRKLVEMGFEQGYASQCDKLDRMLEKAA